MGANHSMTQEEIHEIKENTNFDDETLQRVARSFQSLDIDQSGTLTLDEFQAIAQLQNNPLTERVFAAFDTDKNGSIDFHEFTGWLARFNGSSATDDEDRIRFIFSVYDVNNDGYISNGDLYKSLHVMVGDNLEKEQLQQLVDRTILQGDLDRDGRLGFEEFRIMIESMNLSDKLQLTL